MNSIFLFLALFSLLTSTRADPNATESTIASGDRLKNNPNGPQDNTATSIITVTEDETLNVSKPKQVYKEKTEKNTEKISEESMQAKRISSLEILRNSRNTKVEKSNKRFGQALECVSCIGNGASSAADEDCFWGSPIKIQKCADTELCFTEIHPKYIKRGCVVPMTVNRTFVCKCPLCNDKPSEDLTFFDYKSYTDWEYDNKRLLDPVVGLDLLCKVCETKGSNTILDNKCRFGKTADYMQCGHNEFCYTNIDHQIDFVSRGCISKPAYNSLYYFCNKSKCNNRIYPNPRQRQSRENFFFRTIPLVKVASTSTASITVLGKSIFFVAILPLCIVILSEALF